MNLPPRFRGNHPPAFTGPPVVFIFALVLVGIHTVRQVLPAGFDRELLSSYSFIPMAYSAGAGDEGIPQSILRFVTYAFLHASWSHVLMNGFWLLIFGTPIARRVGSYDFLVICPVTAVGGSATYLAANLGDPVSMIGASGITAGMLGALTGMLYLQCRGNIVSLHHEKIDERILFFAILWLAGDVMNSMNQNTNIAWEAHIGGFASGLVLGLIYGRKPRA